MTCKTFQSAHFFCFFAAFTWFLYANPCSERCSHSCGIYSLSWGISLVDKSFAFHRVRMRSHVSLSSCSHVTSASRHSFSLSLCLSGRLKSALSTIFNCLGNQLPTESFFFPFISGFIGICSCTLSMCVPEFVCACLFMYAH